MVYLHLYEQTGKVHFATFNCRSEKGGCCRHVAAAMLYKIWDYSKVELKMILDYLTCKQVYKMGCTS